MTQEIVLAIVYVLVLAVVNMQIVEYLKRPLTQQFPDAPLWWVVYVAFATGTALAFGFRLDVFEFMPEHPYWLGRLLTGCMIGGGSSLIFDTMKRIVSGLTQLSKSLAELVAIVKQARGVLAGGDTGTGYRLTGTGRKQEPQHEEAEGPWLNDDWDNQEYDKRAREEARRMMSELREADTTINITAGPIDELRYGKEFSHYENLPDPERKA